MIQVRVTVHH